MNSELTIGPFMNYIEKKCSSIWFSNSYFFLNLKLKNNEKNKFFNHKPFAYYVYCYSTKSNHLVYLCSIQNFKLKIEKNIPFDECITTCCFSKNTSKPILFLGTKLGSIHILDLDKLDFILSKNNQFKKIILSEWLDELNVIFSTNHHLYKLDLNSKNIIEILNCELSNITYLTISKNSPFLLAIGYEDGKIKLLSYDRKQNKFNLFTDLDSHKKKICHLCFNWSLGFFKNPLFASISLDGIVIVWNLDNKTEIFQFYNECSNLNNFKNIDYIIDFLPTLPEKVLEIKKKNENNSIDNNENLYSDNLDKNISFSLKQLNQSNEKYFKLIISKLNGNLITIKVPKYPSNNNVSFIPKASNFEKNNSFFHSKPIFAINILGQTDFLCNKKSNKTYFDLNLPLIAITESYDKSIIIWDLIEKKSKSYFPLLVDPIYYIESNPFDKNLFAFAGGNSLKLLNLSEKLSSYPYNWNQISIKKLSNELITSLSWHPENEYIIALGTYDGSIFVYDISKNDSKSIYHCIKDNKNKNFNVYTICWGPFYIEKDSIRFCENELEMNFIWSIYCITGIELKILVTDNLTVYSISEISDCLKNCGQTELAWKSDYTFLAVGYDDGSINIFKNNQTGKHFLSLIIIIENCFTNSIHQIKWHPTYIYKQKNEETMDNKSYERSRNEYLIAVSSTQSHIIFVNLEHTIKKIQEKEILSLPFTILDKYKVLNSNTNRIAKLAWSNFKEGYIASSSYDKKVIVWNINQDDRIACFDGHSNFVFSVCWSLNDPDLLISGGNDRMICIWKLSKQIDNKKYEETLKKINLINSDEKSLDLMVNNLVLNDEIQEKEFDENNLNNLEYNLDKTEKIHLIENDINLNEQESNTIIYDKIKTNLNKDNLEIKERNRKLKDKKPKNLLTLTNINENSLKKEDYIHDINLMLEKRNKIKFNLDKNLNDISHRLLFYGDCEDVSKLLKLESDYRLNLDDLHSSTLINLLGNNIKDVIENAMKNYQLTDYLVAMSASISQKFWYDTVVCYSQQLEKEGDIILASEYLLSIFKIKEALNILIKHKYLKEALIVAKTRFPEKSLFEYTIINLLANEYNQKGNLYSEIKCWLSIDEYYECARVLSKYYLDPFLIKYCVKFCKMGLHSQNQLNYS